ncbi:Dabb family protein [Microbacterium sp. 1.5R]|uniref:Dabb family protein n=1 Tax=Microbacterium sp. 1.5R TaxID=1916917 RepID=UPI0011A6DABB|nr:Dabb family protein [Microbacterium sp. 1.5R]
MVTHIGLLTLQETATDADRQAIGDGLLGLVGQIDGLEAVRVGTDLGLKDGNGDLLFQLDFASEDAWRAYAAHPAHQAVITQHIAPVLASKAFVQVDGFREARA